MNGNPAMRAQLRCLDLLVAIVDQVRGPAITQLPFPLGRRQPDI